MLQKTLLEYNRLFNDNRYLKADSANAYFAYIEMLAGFSFAYLSNFKYLSYDTTGNLTSIGIYTNSSMTARLFNKELSYDSSGNLISVEMTRDSDGTRLTKSLAYDSSGNLQSITITYA
jgi:hypothetical protein